MSLKTNKYWVNLLEKVAIADQIQNSSLADIEIEMLDILKKKFRNRAIHIYFFGSRIMGIAEKSSDLDIYVEIDNGFNEYNYKLTSKLRTYQDMIVSAFRVARNWIFEISCGGPCPVVKAQHISSHIKCDISFASGLTVHQNELVIYFFKKQPIARYMVLFLRGWVKELHLQEEFRSHILVLMVIYFLQIRNFLPAIKRIQAGISPNIKPWVTIFNEFDLSDFNMVPIKVVDQEMRKILKEFFSYYASFNSVKYAICPYLGTEIARDGFANAMPLAFQMSYQFDRNIVIQDLIHLNHNKGGIISMHGFLKFQAKAKVESQ